MGFDGFGSLLLAVYTKISVYTGVPESVSIVSVFILKVNVIFFIYEIFYVTYCRILYLWYNKYQNRQKIKVCSLKATRSWFE